MHDAIDFVSIFVYVHLAGGPSHTMPARYLRASGEGQAKSVGVVLPAGTDEAGLRAMVEALLLGLYVDNRFKTGGCGDLIRRALCGVCSCSACACFCCSACACSCCSAAAAAQEAAPRGAAAAAEAAGWPSERL